MAILKIGNTPRDYAWGSTELIPQLLGVEPDGNPQAEIWFGTHLGSPAMVLDAENGSLRERVGELGFLVKFLAAAKPLSIQAHPTKEHAHARFAAGYPGYTDGNHKPELIAAISPFEALCGFRSVAAILEDLTAITGADSRFESWLNSLASSGLRGATDWALNAEPALASALVENASAISTPYSELLPRVLASAGEDVGVLVALLMNYVELQPGEALYLPAGNIHAYLSGLGVEVMAASDNVLRGGLTQKPIDVPELMNVVDFTELAEPRAIPQQLSAGLYQYPVGVPDFQVYRVEPSGSTLLVDLRLSGRAILVCTAGEIMLSTSHEDSLTLARGEACYFDGANYFSVLGSGTGYLAMG